MNQDQASLHRLTTHLSDREESQQGVWFPVAKDDGSPQVWRPHLFGGLLELMVPVSVV